MSEASLLHELIDVAVERSPDATSLSHGGSSWSYAELHDQVRRFAAGLISCGLGRGDRIGIFLEKRFETVVASFGAVCAGCAFVPINPILKSEQVAYILRDGDVRMLVTTAARYEALDAELAECPSITHVALTESMAPTMRGTSVLNWRELLETPLCPGHRVIDVDMAAILYTSGSTGRPKGVVLSHRNMVAGAKSVAAYLGNDANDVLLAALPLSFDAGFSQLTTAFHVGASVVLLNYLVPRDVLKALHQERVTGLTAVPRSTSSSPRSNGPMEPANRYAISPIRAVACRVPRLPPCANACRRPSPI
jgi:long-subunit acyl-CoA synthetase (AMP-forming)